MRKTIILIGTFLYRHCTNHHVYDVKFPNFKFYGGQQHKKTIFDFFSLNSDTVLKGNVTRYEAIRNDDF